MALTLTVEEIRYQAYRNPNSPLFKARLASETFQAQLDAYMDKQLQQQMQQQSLQHRLEKALIRMSKYKELSNLHRALLTPKSHIDNRPSKIKNEINSLNKEIALREYNIVEKTNQLATSILQEQNPNTAPTSAQLQTVVTNLNTLISTAHVGQKAHALFQLVQNTQTAEQTTSNIDNTPNLRPSELLKNRINHFVKDTQTELADIQRLYKARSVLETTHKTYSNEELETPTQLLERAVTNKDLSPLGIQPTPGAKKNDEEDANKLSPTR